MSGTSDACLDPRPAVQSRGLASRPAAGGTSRRIVFFDNGKLSPPYMRWMPVNQPLLEGLSALGTVTQESSDLLIEPIAEQAPRIERWLEAGVDGAVFALCDAGVGAPTLMLAAAAEAAGIPTVVIGTDQVMDLLAAAAAFQAPGLPLVMLPGGRLDTPQQLAESARTIVPAVVAGLTEDAAALIRQFEQRYSFVKDLPRREGDTPPGERDFSAFAQKRMLTDGFPVVAPTRPRVAAMIDRVQREPGEVLVTSLTPSGAPLTLEQTAICAVMAGALPADFPFILAALDLMSQPDYKLHIGTITTHPCGHLLLFSGPAAQAAGIASGRGCFGPNQRANLAIGRSLSLTFQNAGRAVPGLSTLSGMGGASQISCCFADQIDAPLPPLHTTLGDGKATIAWGTKAESPHNVMDHLSTTPEMLLGTFCSVAATLGGNNAYYPNDLLLIMNPEHAQIIARAGWTRADIGRYVWEHARNDRVRMEGRGMKSEWPAEWASWDRIPVVPSPERVWVVVAGAPGPQSQVAIPWASHACWTVVPE